MKKAFILRTVAIILSLVVSVSVISGCSSNDADTYIYLNLQKEPVSLDPQTAQTDEELLIVRNIFEGLLRKNSKGEIVCGACKNYVKKGLDYTFYLKNNICWSNGEKLTAKDFVFAFRRAVTPNVKSPFANRIMCIKNAKTILSGNASPLTLGVAASDDYTLKISLSYNDIFFEDALTTSVCMPCNESFFNGRSGKYGLDADSIISNGSYRLTKWNPDDFAIRLYKNEKYDGDFKAKNGALFISSNKKDKIETLFKKESIDLGLVDNSNLQKVTETGAKNISFQNICWVMTVGGKFDSKIRKALAWAVSKDSYKDKLPLGFTLADSIFPEMFGTGGTVSQKAIIPYNIEKAKAVISDYVLDTDDKQFPSCTLYYYDNEGILPAIRGLLGHWQQNLCAFVNITPAKVPDELVGQLTEKNLDFAVFPVRVKSKNISEYLLNFGSFTGSPEKIQEEIFRDGSVIPLAFENTNICYRDNVKNLYCDEENGYIDFSFAEKK